MPNHPGNGSKLSKVLKLSSTEAELVKKALENQIQWYFEYPVGCEQCYARGRNSTDVGMEGCPEHTREIGILKALVRRMNHA